MLLVLSIPSMSEFPKIGHLNVDPKQSDPPHKDLQITPRLIYGSFLITQNNIPLDSEVAHNALKVAHNHRPRAYSRSQNVGI